jgi:hypothetical protein
MDIESFGTAIELFNKALTAAKKNKDLLPQNPQKEAVAQTLIEAEKAFGTICLTKQPLQVVVFGC